MRSIMIGLLLQICMAPMSSAATAVSIAGNRWQLNGAVTYAGAPAEGLLMNVRMVNATFEDANPQTCPKGFDPEANTRQFLTKIPDYVAHGIRAFTLCLQGGSCGYEGARNSAFAADGSLRPAYMERIERTIRACDAQGAAVILTCFYQRQDQVLADNDAVRQAVKNAARWIEERGFSNVLLEIANEVGHPGFDHSLLKSADAASELITLAKRHAPGLLVSTSGLGNGTLPARAAESADFVLVHFNDAPVMDIPKRIAALKKYGKPIVCNEDQKTGVQGAEAAAVSVTNGASWGLMLVDHNQHWPFQFDGAADDPAVYAKLQHLTTADDYFPPPLSQGGWRPLVDPEQIRQRAGMDPNKLEVLKEWLFRSDNRDFAAVVIRHGYVVLDVARGNSGTTDSRRVASVSKAICATVLAIASEESQQNGQMPRRMTFDDRAFDYLPQAMPLSDARKRDITVRQLLNHTSGICPEAIGAPNDGSWEYVLGLNGDARTARLAFDPGTACGYSTHAFCHAALVCETVTGKPYDAYAIEALFQPLGCAHWWFQYYDGGASIGRHPSHGMGMPAHDLARIAYCMLRRGRWNDRQVIPEWFVEDTGRSSHAVTTPEMRWQLNPAVFTLGWERPAMHWPSSGKSIAGIPDDARYKPGSGGQLMAFVPSLDLVITRQTGSSGGWAFEEYLRLACDAVVPSSPGRGD